MARVRISKAWYAWPWQARRAGEDYGATATPDWRTIDWRSYLRQTDIEGRTVNYVDTGLGDGQPAVLIHGLGGCWQNWLETIPRLLDEGRRVIALDLPGFGFSEMPRERISISGYGRAVEALLERLEISQAALVGNSMGGFIGAECAIQYPQRVSSLVLVSAAGISSTNLQQRPLLAGARVFAAVATRVAANSERVVVRPRLRQPLWGMIFRHPQRLRPELLYEVTQGSARPGFLPALHALTDYDFRDRLPDISSPTLVVWGDGDMLVGVDDADEFERQIPGARKVVFEDTGHMAMVERPGKFNDLIVEFLSTAAGSEESPGADRDESSKRATSAA